MAKGGVGGSMHLVGRKTKKIKGYVPFTRAGKVVVKSMRTGEILREEMPLRPRELRKAILSGTPYPRDHRPR